MLCPHDTDRDAPVHSPVFLFVGKHEVMYLPDDTFGHRRTVFHQLTYKVKSFLMPHGLHVVFERFPVDSEPSKNHVRFAQSQRIAFYRIGIVGVFNSELFAKAYNFTFSKGATGS